MLAAALAGWIVFELADRTLLPQLLALLLFLVAFCAAVYGFVLHWRRNFSAAARQGEREALRSRQPWES